MSDKVTIPSFPLGHGKVVIGQGMTEEGQPFVSLSPAPEPWPAPGTLLTGLWEHPPEGSVAIVFANLDGAALLMAQIGRIIEQMEQAEQEPEA
jgi:hypothetical protein